MTAPVEIEIKFLLPEGGADALGDHPAPRGSEAGPPSRTTTTYCDKAGRAFVRAGASFRLRRAGRHRVQTLKLRDGSGPFGRGEWEWALTDGQPDPRRPVAALMRRPASARDVPGRRRPSRRPPC